MAAFYRPSGERSTIIIESGPTLSDRYAVACAARAPRRAGRAASSRWAPLREGWPPPTSSRRSRRHERLALVLLGGVNYLTGQVFDMGAIAAAVQPLQRGGLRPAARHPRADLAHAVGRAAAAARVGRRLCGVVRDQRNTQRRRRLRIAGMDVSTRRTRPTSTPTLAAGWWRVWQTIRDGARLRTRRGRAFGFAVSNVNPLLVACARRGAARAQARRRRPRAVASRSCSPRISRR